MPREWNPEQRAALQRLAQDISQSRIQFQTGSSRDMLCSGETVTFARIVVGRRHTEITQRGVAATRAPSLLYENGQHEIYVLDGPLFNGWELAGLSEDFEWCLDRDPHDWRPFTANMAPQHWRGNFLVRRCSDEHIARLLSAREARERLTRRFEDTRITRPYVSGHYLIITSFVNHEVLSGPFTIDEADLELASLGDDLPFTVEVLYIGPLAVTSSCSHCHRPAGFNHQVGCSALADHPGG